MFTNEPQNPTDFFTYVAHGTFNQVEAPLWVYVDTDIMEVPEGTMGLSFTLEHPLEVADPSDEDNPARSPDDIWCFETPIDVAQWHNYFRLEHWPRNVFRSLQTEGLNTRRSTGTELLDDAAEVYYYEVEFDYIDEVSDPSIWPRNPHTAFQNFVVPHLRGPRTFTILENTWERPASLSRTIAALESGATEMPLWIFGAVNEVEFFHQFQETGTVYLDSRGHSYGEDFEHLPTATDEDAEGAYSIPYYHDESWPQGLGRLVDNYRYEGDAAQPAPHVIGATCGAASNMIEPARLGIDYVRNADIRGALDVRDKLLRPSVIHVGAQEWWTWGESQNALPNGTGGTVHILRHDGHDSSVWMLEDGFTNRVGEGGEMHPTGWGSMPTSNVSHSLYRHPRWAQNVWCSAWKDDGTPTYGPDAMGVAYDESVEGSPDESTWDNPVTDPDNFAFQTWVKFASWHPTATDHGVGRQVWIGRDSVQSSAFFSGANVHTHCYTGWTNSEREHEALYYRRRHFPDGVYRRVDNFTVEGYGDSSIHRSQHHDEPDLSECGAPWHSQYLKDWIEAMSAEIGRPIFSDPMQGAPFLRVWDPALTEEHGSVTVNLGGNQVVMCPASQQEIPVGFEEQAAGRIQCQDGHNIGTRYRTGIDLHFDPCSARYVSGSARQEGAPDNALWLYLQKIEDFFRNYRDPDVILDIADSLYARVETKRNSFRGRLEDKQVQVQQFQERINTVVAEISQIYENMAVYDGMSLDGYRATLERNRDLITRHGVLSHSGNTLTLTMNVFEIQGQELGPMNIKLQLSTNFNVSVHAVRGCRNKSQHGHVHPHVENGRSGHICWGNGSTMASQLARGIDPLELLFAVAEFLKHGYEAPGAYCRIGQWHRVETWWCDPCRDDHPQDTPCPNVCQRCSNRVEWDEHGTCAEHQDQCWSYHDRETCPTCEAEQAAEVEVETGDAHNHADGDASAAE